jgi:hypothetical protein
MDLFLLNEAAGIRGRLGYPRRAVHYRGFWAATAAPAACALQRHLFDFYG